MPKHCTNCEEDSLKVKLSLWLTNPLPTQDDQIITDKKGTREDSRQDKSDKQKDQEKEEKVKYQISSRRLKSKATTDCQKEKEASLNQA